MRRIHKPAIRAPPSLFVFTARHKKRTGRYEQMAQSKSHIISDYTLNKKSPNIEYQFADGENVPGSNSYTAEDFINDNPDKSTDDYVALKEFSDNDYHEQKLSDYNTTRLNWNIEWAEQKGLCSVSSPEDILIAQINAEEYRRKRERQAALAKKALDRLTESQRRRFILSAVYGLTTRQIADREGVSHVAVVYSLEAVEKKIKKALENG